MTVRSLYLAAVVLTGVAVPAAAAPLPRPASFAMCGVCHKTAANEKSVVGPNLWKVAGRKAGATDFAYSPAMKNAKITWNKASLTAFVTDPKGVVPGNRMAYAGQKNRKMTAEIVNYLLSLK